MARTNSLPAEAGPGVLRYGSSVFIIFILGILKATQQTDKEVECFVKTVVPHVVYTYVIKLLVADMT